MSEPVLRVDGLSVRYGDVTAVEDATFEVRPGEKVAIVGESGSGKTSLGMAIAGFVDPAAGETSATRIHFDGRDLDRVARRRIPSRTPGMSMVFQDAMTSLDPVWTVGSQLVAVLRSTGSSRRAAVASAKEWMREVGLRDPNHVMGSRPYELSGGMRQRVMMAIALCSKPSLLIADEPTSALDASLAVSAMRLMVDLAEREGAAVLVISHDLELCRRFTDFVLVMYQGRIVEQVRSSELENVTDPYTQGLLHCVPTLESASLDRLPTLAQFMPEVPSDAQPADAAGVAA